MHHRTRLSVVLASAVVLVAGVLGGAASAKAPNGVKGDPQPEIKPFRLGPSNDSGASVAIEANGDLVTAYGVSTSNDEGATRVCVMKRGADSCTSTATLDTENGESMFSTSQVFAVGTDVYVVMNTCCSSADTPNGGDLLFTSTDGGKTFNVGVRVGNVGTTAGELIGSNIVIAGGDHDGAEVESFGTTSSFAPPVTATVNDNQPVDVGLGTYKGGVLVGNDIDGSIWTTKIEYASSSKDFDASASYATVGSFSNEQLIGVSQNAVLTQQVTGKKHVLLRFFNGTGLTAPKVVPGFSGTTLGSWISVDKDPAGVTHIFSDSAFSSPTYELFERSTTTGSSFSTPIPFGDGVDYSAYPSALDSIGSGLAVGIGDKKAEAFPVLAPQSATFSLSKSSIKKGKHVTAKGVGTVAAKNRVVTLQVEHKGKWHNVTTTKESASGKFHFTIKGAAAGTFHYRAVANDKAGYILFGYSASRTLAVRK